MFLRVVRGLKRANFQYLPHRGVRGGGIITDQDAGNRPFFMHDPFPKAELSEQLKKEKLIFSAIQYINTNIYGLSFILIA